MSSSPTDNKDLGGKLLVRREALAALEGQPARVLDCFAGEGHMFENVWHQAAEYLGMEKRFARPAGHPRGECWRGDNRMLIDRALQRADWNVIDLDAYGSPWQLFRVAARGASAPRLVVTLTCGLSRSLCSSTAIPRWAQLLSGTQDLSYRALVRWYDDVIRWTMAHALAPSAYQVQKVQRTRCRKSKDVWYWLVQLRRG